MHASFVLFLAGRFLLLGSGRLWFCSLTRPGPLYGTMELLQSWILVAEIPIILRFFEGSSFSHISHTTFAYRTNLIGIYRKLWALPPTGYIKLY